MNSTRKQQSGHDVAVQDRATIAPSQADVDEIERFLREQFSTRPAGQNAEASDPLMAELARIVGQDVRPIPASAPEMPRAHDPFAAPAPAPFSQAGPDATDPLSAFEEELRRFDAAHRTPVAEPEVQAAMEASAPAPDLVQTDYDLRGVVPASQDHAQTLPDLDFAPVLADRGIRMPHPDQATAPQYSQQLEPEGVIAEDLEPMAPPPAPRSRKVMMLLGGAAAIAVVGVIGSVAFGTKGPKSGGDVPIIAAKTQPAKEKPADPGGVEVPGQDRQVLARKTEEPKAAASVVSKEEQPVDLNQTPKREVSRVILAAPAQGNAPAAPIMMPQGSQSAQPVTAGGFEAKRVRSVKIGNDGEPAPAATAAAPAAPVRPAAPSLVSAPPPTGVATAAKVEPPKAAAPKVEAPKSDARPATAPRTPQSTAATTPQPARVVQSRPVAPAPSAPAAESNGESPMSLRPPSGSAAARPVRTAAATTATAPTAAASGGGGGFSVQLAAPGSEAEARTVANRLKQRHASALDGYAPGVRKADVNGKAVYRVRVGGLSRDDANSLCTSIKADGGSCFVASN